MNAFSVLSSDAPGFTKLAVDPNWTVGIVNYTDVLKEDHLIKRERHFLTDELFILAQGEAHLYIGEEMKKTVLQVGKAYLVKKGTWHAISVSEDAKVFVVENTDTSDENSEKFYFDCVER